ncbi:unnamed protein product, partial [Effrenium voratum]
ALRWLQEQHVIEVDGGYRSVGADVSQAIKQRCFDRMRSWFQMACLQIKAEWGEFEAIHAFGVFSLKPKLSLSTVREKLDKLVTVFGSTTRSQNAVDRLLHQFLDYQAYASKQRAMIADDERHPDVTSWCLSVSKKPQPSNDRDLTLMVARSLMLKRAHSSGNERDFADIVCRLGKSRMAAKAQIKSMERRLREACSSPAATAKLIT